MEFLMAFVMPDKTHDIQMQAEIGKSEIWISRGGTQTKANEVVRRPQKHTVLHPAVQDADFSCLKQLTVYLKVSLTSGGQTLQTFSALGTRKTKGG